MSNDRPGIAPLIRSAAALLSVGAIVLVGRQFLRQAPVGRNSLPSSGSLGNFMPAPADPSVEAFSLKGTQCVVVTDPDTGLRAPYVNFEVEAPMKTDLTRFEAWIAGSDGSRLDLDVQTTGPNTHMLVRQGYEHAPPEPRLIVRHLGQTVIESPVASLVAPIRAIPLVVPIDPSVDVRPTQGPPLTFVVGVPDRFWYKIAGGGAPLGQASDARLARSEWGPGAGFLRGPERKGQPLVFYALKNAMPRAFGEIELSTLLRERFVRDVEVEVEIHDREGPPAVTLSQPVTVEFPDHASVTIPTQTIRVEARRADLPGIVRLDLKSKPGVAAMFLSQVGSSSPNAELGILAGRSVAPPPTPFECALVAPSLETLGIRRLTLGASPAAKLENPGRIPLALGRHRLKFRITHHAEHPLLRRVFAPFPPAGGPGAPPTPRIGGNSRPQLRSQ
ncbi:MAG: hypothetical protein ACO1SV_02150 [Fimbriimonas sp.]